MTSVVLKWLASFTSIASFWCVVLRGAYTWHKPVKKGYRTHTINHIQVIIKKQKTKTVIAVKAPLGHLKSQPQLWRRSRLRKPEFLSGNALTSRHSQVFKINKLGRQFLSTSTLTHWIDPLCLSSNLAFSLELFIFRRFHSSHSINIQIHNKFEVSKTCRIQQPITWIWGSPATHWIYWSNPSRN